MPGSSPQSDVEWAKQELSGAASSLLLVQERLTQAVRTLEQENDSLRAQLADRSWTSRRVSVLIEENERLVQQLGTAIATKAVIEQERDDALAKLANTRKVIRDLLSEQKQGGATREDALEDWEHVSANKSDTSPLGHSLSRPLSFSALSSTPQSPNTDATIRFPSLGHRHSSTNLNTNARPSSTLHAVPEGDAPAPLGEPFQLRMPSAPPASRGTRRRVLSADGRSSLHRPSPTTSPGTIGSTRRHLTAGGMASVEASPGSEAGWSVHFDADSAAAIMRWRIHFGKPPVSAKTVVGPLGFEDVVNRLELDETTVSILDSLANAANDNIRLHVTQNIAFIFDPIVLETTNSRYIVNWSPPKVNDRMLDYISETSKSRPLYTFISSSKKKGWFYIGLYDWREASATVSSVWPALSPKAQRAVAACCNAGPSSPSGMDFSRLLEQGEMAQCAIELTDVLEGQQAGLSEKMVAVLRR